MDEKDQEPTTFEVTFGERTIEFKQPSDGQLAVIARGVRKAKRGGGSNTIEAIGLILDVIDKLAVDPNDRDWLEEGLTDASIDLEDFIGVLDGINSDGEDVKETPHPVSAARARRNGRA
jgi:hypothetical protein